MNLFTDVEVMTVVVDTVVPLVMLGIFAAMILGEFRIVTAWFRRLYIPVTCVLAYLSYKLAGTHAGLFVLFVSAVTPLVALAFACMISWLLWRRIARRNGVDSKLPADLDVGRYLWRTLFLGRV